MERWVTLSMLAFMLLFLYGCTANPRFGTGSRSSGGHNIPAYSGRSSVLTIEGIASYYAHEFHGRTTANGEKFDMHAMTAAHKTFPFNTIIRVQNLSNDKSVIVRINDRGPFVEGRIIDLSLGAAREIDMKEAGTARVRLEVLEWGQE